MRAIVQDEYGTAEVVELREIDRPAIGDDDVLVRVHASALNALDWHMMTGTPYLVRPQAGLRRPKGGIRGADLAGTVEAVGSNVTRFQKGDEVFGEVGGRGLAEYARAPERTLIPKPAGVTFEQAAALPVAALTALQGLRDVGGLEPGNRVLVNGASGGVGTFAVQIAKVLGAEVTAVCSTRNVETARSIGADHVIDYKKTDFTEDGQVYDLIFDGPANRPWKDIKRLLKPGGTYVMYGGPKGRWLGPLPRILRFKLASMIGDRRMGFFVAKMNQEDLTLLSDLLASDEIAPVIEKTYSLEEAPEALRYLGEGHARGKLVITP